MSVKIVPVPVSLQDSILLILYIGKPALHLCAHGPLAHSRTGATGELI